MDNIPFMKPYLGNNARTCPQSTSNNPVFVRLTEASDLNFRPPLIMWRRLAGPGTQVWPEISPWCDECEPLGPGHWSLVTTAPAMRANIIKCLCLFCTSLIRSESERMLVLMTYCDYFFGYLANVISFHLQFPVSSLIMQQNHDSDSQLVLDMSREGICTILGYCGTLWGYSYEVLVWYFHIFLRFYFVQFNQLNFVTSSMQSG